MRKTGGERVGGKRCFEEGMIKEVMKRVEPGEKKASLLLVLQRLDGERDECGRGSLRSGILDIPSVTLSTGGGAVQPGLLEGAWLRKTRRVSASPSSVVIRIPTTRAS